MEEEALSVPEERITDSNVETGLSVDVNGNVEENGVETATEKPTNQGTNPVAADVDILEREIAELDTLISTQQRKLELLKRLRELKPSVGMYVQQNDLGKYDDFLFAGSALPSSCSYSKHNSKYNHTRNSIITNSSKLEIK